MLFPRAKQKSGRRRPRRTPVNATWFTGGLENSSSHALSVLTFCWSPEERKSINPPFQEMGAGLVATKPRAQPGGLRVWGGRGEVTDAGESLHTFLPGPPALTWENSPCDRLHWKIPPWTFTDGSRPGVKIAPRTAQPKLGVGEALISAGQKGKKCFHWAMRGCHGKRDLKHKYFTFCLISNSFNCPQQKNEKYLQLGGKKYLSFFFS